MTRTAPTTAAELLLRARQEAGLSQRELADKAGVAQPEIARIESGKREPSIPTIRRIVAGAGLELRLRLVPVVQPVVQPVDAPDRRVRPA